jgi:hypothetical protein
MRMLIALSLIPISACSPTTGAFPDLAVRPIESRSDAVAAPPASTATPDPAMAATAEALSIESAAYAATFDEKLAKVQSRARAAGPEGSESWVAAQLGLTDLDRLRARTVSDLAEFDRMLVAEYAANRPVAPKTAAVATELQVRADAQARAIDGVKALLTR